MCTDVRLPRAATRASDTHQHLAKRNVRDFGWEIADPLLNFRNNELIDISASSINVPTESSLKLGPIRGTSLIEAAN